jgi:hypothetical protein
MRAADSRRHLQLKESFGVSRWRDVEALQERLRHANARADAQVGEHERVTQRVAFVQEGVVALLARFRGLREQLAAVAGKSHAIWTPAQAQGVLQLWAAQLPQAKQQEGRPARGPKGSHRRAPSKSTAEQPSPTQLQQPAVPEQPVVAADAPLPTVTVAQQL